MKSPLHRAQELELRSKAYGFYWQRLDQLVEQAESECQEIAEAYESGDRVHLEEELGDLILAASSLAVFCGFNPHDVLEKASDKYERRFNKLKDLAQQDGKETLAGEDFEVLKHYWKEAKK